MKCKHAIKLLEAEIKGDNYIDTTSKFLGMMYQAYNKEDIEELKAELKFLKGLE